MFCVFSLTACNVSTHSHPKVAASINATKTMSKEVSTHSHPKVAALRKRKCLALRYQFQHTATRRWLRHPAKRFPRHTKVSTHSHPKVAAEPNVANNKDAQVSTHSHPKVAAIKPCAIFSSSAVSTHSHPKVAAFFKCFHRVPYRFVSTHSHPKVAAIFHYPLNYF